LLNPNPLMPQLQGRWTSILWPRVPFSSCLSDCLPDRLVKWRYLSKQHILLCRLTDVVTRFRGDCLHQGKTACISETSVNFYETTRRDSTSSCYLQRLFCEPLVDTSVSEKYTVSIFRTDGGSMSLRNVSIYLQVHTALQPKIPIKYIPVPWKFIAATAKIHRLPYQLVISSSHGVLLLHWKTVLTRHIFTELSRLLTDWRVVRDTLN
jgi:hypothetical protein